MNDTELTRISREWDIPRSALDELLLAPEEKRGVLMKELKRRVSLRMLGL